jgi:DNA transformation protein
MARGELDAAIAQALDLFAEIRGVRARRMFGGAGLYVGEVMFGLLSDGAIYLKADDQLRPEFEAEGSSPFVYQPSSAARPVAMSYWRLPDSALDDSEAACAWAGKALDAARRSKAPGKRRPPRTS